MDGRVKPGNDAMEQHSRGAFFGARVLFHHNDNARSRKVDFRFSDKIMRNKTTIPAPIFVR